MAVQCRDLLFVIEGVHGENFHRIDLVFLCDCLGKAECAAPCKDTSQIGFEWLDLSVLNRLPLFPSKLRRPIMNFYEEKNTQNTSEMRRLETRNVSSRDLFAQASLEIKTGKINIQVLIDSHLHGIVKRVHLHAKPVTVHVIHIDAAALRIDNPVFVRLGEAM